MLPKEYLIECCSKVSTLFIGKTTQNNNIFLLFFLQNNIFQCNFDRGLRTKLKHPNSIQFLFGSISSPDLGNTHICY